MPRNALTQTERTAFRERAVVVCTQLFAERGPEKVTMRAIAAELGVSAMTPYRYFENKGELFSTVRAHAFRRFAAQQEAAFSAGGTAHQVVRRLGLSYVTFALEEPDAYRIMFQLGHSQSEDPEVGREALRGISFLVETIKRGVADGVYEGDPLTVAQLKWATIHGILSLHLAGKLVMERSVTELVDAALTEGAK